VKNVNDGVTSLQHNMMLLLLLLLLLMLM